MPQKNPYLNQATQKNTCQIFLPKKILESNISNPKNPSIIPVTWNLQYPPGHQVHFPVVSMKSSFSKHPENFTIELDEN